ncbi:MAG: transposase [Muribaculaceae bacterium]|nr:transposase [Muribaculaceae bacterium]
MIVFGVKYRLGLIDQKWENDLYAIIGSILKAYDCSPIKIGGTSDHIHILISKGANAPATKDIVRAVKSNSSKWINDNQLCRGKFAWQRGSGRFSYSYDRLNTLIKYIENQRYHHSRMSFRDEMQKFLSAFNVTANPEYLPDAPQ